MVNVQLFVLHIYRSAGRATGGVEEKVFCKASTILLFEVCLFATTVSDENALNWHHVFNYLNLNCILCRDESVLQGSGDYSISEETCNK